MFLEGKAGIGGARRVKAAGRQEHRGNEFLVKNNHSYQDIPKRISATSNQRQAQGVPLSLSGIKVVGARSCGNHDIATCGEKSLVEPEDFSDESL